MEWVFLSYPWGPDCPAYRDGSKIFLEKIRDFSKGDQGRQIEFKASNHIGTHIDVPAHSCENGLTITDYTANEFIFNSVQLLNIKVPDDALIKSADIENALLQTNKVKKNADFLLLKTGAGCQRQSVDYWQNNPGLSTGVSSLLRDVFPQIRAVGLDSISLTSFNHREEGRKSHREFLCNKHPICIIEDMDLANIYESPSVVIALPLRIINGDGAPVTVIAKF
jgi:arylformamidase